MYTPFDFTARGLTKVLTRIFVGSAVTVTVNKAADIVFDEEELTASDKAVINTGSLFIGMAVADHVSDTTDEIVDVVFDSVNTAKAVKHINENDVNDNQTIIEHEDNL